MRDPVLYRSMAEPRTGKTICKIQDGGKKQRQKRMDIGIAHWPPYWFLPSCGLSTSKKHFRSSAGERNKTAADLMSELAALLEKDKKKER